MNVCVFVPVFHPASIICLYPECCKISVLSKPHLICVYFSHTWRIVELLSVDFCDVNATWSVCWVTQLKLHLACGFMCHFWYHQWCRPAVKSGGHDCFLWSQSFLVSSSDIVWISVDSSSMTTALLVILLLLFAELLVSWKTRQMHTYWIIRMSSRCMQQFLSLGTTALCWSLFLMGVLKNTLTRTRYTSTRHYVGVLYLCEKFFFQQQVTICV